MACYGDGRMNPLFLLPLAILIYLALIALVFLPSGVMILWDKWFDR